MTPAQKQMTPAQRMARRRYRRTMRRARWLRWQPGPAGPDEWLTGTLALLRLREERLWAAIEASPDHRSLAAHHHHRSIVSRIEPARRQIPIASRPRVSPAAGATAPVAGANP